MKTAILFFLLLLGYSLKAQTTTNYAHALELNNSVIFIDKTLRVSSAPQWTIRKKKHQFLFGPLLIATSDIVVSNKDYPKLVGAKGGYRFFPNGSEHTVNLFVHSEVDLMRIRDQWTSVVWNPSINSYQDFQYINREYLLQAALGYGIEFVITERVTLYQSVNLGVYYSITAGKKVTPNAPELTNSNINGYDDFGLKYGLGLGVSYRW